jgi:hypothetical protein
MQATTYELVSKFRFLFPEDDCIRVRIATTLMPANSRGDKSLLPKNLYDVGLNNACPNRQPCSISALLKQNAKEHLRDG